MQTQSPSEKMQKMAQNMPKNWTLKALSFGSGKIRTFNPQKPDWVRNPVFEKIRGGYHPYFSSLLCLFFSLTTMCTFVCIKDEALINHKAIAC